MSRSKKGRAQGNHAPTKSPLVELPIAELYAIVERARSAPLGEEDHAALKTAVGVLAFVTQELQAKKASIGRLRKMLFGSPTEKTSALLGEPAENAAQTAGGEGDAGAGGENAPRRRGHGRNAAAAYTGAEKVKVPHPTLCSGDCCPECAKGRVYPLGETSPILRITGMAPLGATLYECDRLRCNLCGEVYTAPSPEGIGEKKYDESATAMIGQLKYGAGLPFNRIEKLQGAMGIPLPAATQWELVRDGAAVLEPVHEELVHQAAQGKVLHNDDTTCRILDLTRRQRAAAAADEDTDERTGVFTSGIVSTAEGRTIALFFSGAKHAGENLAAVLARRAEELPPPIQMCDGLSHNTAGDFESVLGNCLAHARRRYADVVEAFPAECRFVLETLREVYRTDERAKQQALSPEDRLKLHQKESEPRMKALAEWMTEQLDGRKVEPNSGLGSAIRYMQKHWAALTLFLTVPGAPLDNNVCERSLKKAILHRKNALFYRTLNGARVGDVFMSLIHTAELNHVAPWDYLLALLRHPVEIARDPAGWMPWNFRETLAGLPVPATSPP
jgi:transposase